MIGYEAGPTAASPAYLFQPSQRGKRCRTQKRDIGCIGETTSRRDSYQTDPEPISQLARHISPVPAGGASTHSIAQTAPQVLKGELPQP